MNVKGELIPNFVKPVKENLIFDKNNPTETTPSRTALDEALNIPQENRSLEDYMSILKISLDDLGKKILDLGSGEYELFSKEVAKYGKKVFSVNPALLNRRAKQRAMESSGMEPWQRKSSAALAQELPFKDNTFDSIVSLYAIPHWLDPKYWRLSFLEIQRVLRPGGKGFLGPIGGHDMEEMKTILDESRVAHKFENLSPLNVTGFKLVITK